MNCISNSQLQPLYMTEKSWLENFLQPLIVSKNTNCTFDKKQNVTFKLI